MSKKRVDIVSLQMVKEKSVLYETRTIRNSFDIFVLLRDFLENSDREKIMLVCLNTKNEPINISTVSIGTLKNSLVSPREVFKTAILSNSNKIILAHNHPSGNPKPSQDDLNVTSRIVQAGYILDIELLDHIIIGDGTYCSIREMSAQLFKQR